jgi:exonuclease III
MNLTILSYNLNGMGNVDTLATIMKKHKWGIILLQETHTDNDNMFFLENRLPNYWWLLHHGKKKRKGVRIGVSQRWCKGENDLHFNTAGDRKGLVVKGEIEVRGSTYLILSVYAHQNNKREVSECVKKMLNPKEMEVLILGGDLNDNADSTSVSNLSAILGRKGGVQVAWDFPTHI